MISEFKAIIAAYPDHFFFFKGKGFLRSEHSLSDNMDQSQVSSHRDVSESAFKVCAPRAPVSNRKTTQKGSAEAVTGVWILNVLQRPTCWGLGPSSAVTGS